jgi:hypothetical protein
MNGNERVWNANEHASNVIKAHTSFGSHPQYRPHDIFAHIAPINMPAVNKNKAQYNSEE